MASSPYLYVLPEVINSLKSAEPFKNLSQQATRFSFSEALLTLGEINPNVVVLDADVAKSIQTTRFTERFPDRSFNFGIAEQNMMAAAAGMATTGLIPFACTYAIFASMRALDQVRNSIHYTHLNVKIAASHSGITPGPDGVTHQAQEDLSIIRALAGSTILAPADPVTTRMTTLAAADWDGPVYLSLTRDPVPTIYSDDFPFKIGKAVEVRQGKDVTIIANRDLVAHSLLAAEKLAAQGLDVRVIDCHTLKPLDEEMVLRAAHETGAIVTVEDNIKFGGLGSAVAEILVENYPIPMQRIAIGDTFAESGPYLALLDRYGLSAPHIEKAVLKVISRKQK